MVKKKDWRKLTSDFPSLAPSVEHEILKDIIQRNIQRNMFEEKLTSDLLSPVNMKYSSLALPNLPPQGAKMLELFNNM